MIPHIRFSEVPNYTYFGGFGLLMIVYESDGQFRDVIWVYLEGPEISHTSVERGGRVGGGGGPGDITPFVRKFSENPAAPQNSILSILRPLFRSSPNSDLLSLFPLRASANRPSAFGIWTKEYPISKWKKSLPHRTRAIEWKCPISRESPRRMYKPFWIIARKTPPGPVPKNATFCRSAS